MKIAFILPSLAHTGPILVAKNIVDYIHDKAEVDVYYFDAIEEVNFLCKTFKIEFNQQIPFDEYDIIHSHMYRPDKYVAKHRKLIMGHSISTIHCDIRKDLKYNYNLIVSLIFRWVWLRYLKKIDKIVYISKSLGKGYYTKYLSSSDSEVILNGLDYRNPISLSIDDRLVFDEIRHKGLKILGTCALLTKRKGLHQIIKAMPRLNDYAFVIVGDGKEKENLINLAKQYDVLDRCYFLGFRIGADSFLPFFDVYIMPSLFEGFGLALIEATLAQKSCVCSDIEVFNELFTEDEVTFFELNNLQSLKSAIEVAYSNKELKTQKAYQKSKDNYSIERMGKNYFELYISLVNEKS
jgi:glycosyltransferase involved in cell wall biosynthesis